MARSGVIDRDLGWDEIKRQLKESSGMSVKVGIQGDAGLRMQDEGQKPTHYDVAVAHEYGTTKLPQRAFIGGTFDRHKRKYLKELKGVGVAIVAARSAIGFLKLVGEIVVADIKARIVNRDPPPFAPWADSTRERKEKKGKGQDPILFDTGQLVGSIRAVVFRGGKEVL